MPAPSSIKDGLPVPAPSIKAGLPVPAPSSG